MFYWGNGKQNYLIKKIGSLIRYIINSDSLDDSMIEIPLLIRNIINSDSLDDSLIGIKL